MPIASRNANNNANVLILALDSSDVLVHRAGGSGAHEFRVDDGNDTVLGKLDSSIGNDATALLIRRNLSGTLTLQRVTMGGVDSGGTGYRVLRVPN